MVWPHLFDGANLEHREVRMSRLYEKDVGARANQQPALRENGKAVPVTAAEATARRLAPCYLWWRQDFDVKNPIDVSALVSQVMDMGTLQERLAAPRATGPGRLRSRPARSPPKRIAP